MPFLLTVTQPPTPPCPRCHLSHPRRLACSIFIESLKTADGELKLPTLPNLPTAVAQLAEPTYVPSADNPSGRAMTAAAKESMSAKMKAHWAARRARQAGG